MDALARNAEGLLGWLSAELCHGSPSSSSHHAAKAKQIPHKPKENKKTLK